MADVCNSYAVFLLVMLQCHVTSVHAAEIILCCTLLTVICQVITDRINATGNAIASIHLSIRPSVLRLFSILFLEPTDHWPSTFACVYVGNDHSSQEMKFKVEVVGQINVVGPTSIEGSFFLVHFLWETSQ